MFERSQVEIIRNRMHEPKGTLMQVVVGPRQTGKSTMISQALERIDYTVHSASADDCLSPNEQWVREEWQQARNLQAQSNAQVILVLDEIQKVKHWSTIVKGLWDADQRDNRLMKVILSGSSSLLIRRGLEDSLKGRFEIIHSPHWSYAECNKAFGYSLDDFLYFGGFPGAARFIDDEKRWQNYMRQSIIEPTISQDVLEEENVRKPALLRSLFELGARYSSQELSYTKMLGQLNDAGNTTTLAHYLDLLDKAGVLCGLQKYHPKPIKQRGSSPRLAVYDTSLMTATTRRRKDLVLEDTELRGHLVESAVGAHLLALSTSEGFVLNWWREEQNEVDFIVNNGELLLAIEVKSGRVKSLGGMKAFMDEYPQALRLVVGGTGVSSCTLEQFLVCKDMDDVLGLLS